MKGKSQAEFESFSTMALGQTEILAGSGILPLAQERLGLRSPGGMHAAR
jgi:hypothetical protein